MGMGMTTWEWEGLGILKAIPAHLYFQMHLMSVETVQLFTSDVPSAILLRGYIYAVNHAIGSVLGR